MEHFDEAAVAEINERCKSNTKRINELSAKVENIADLTTSVKVLAEREARMETDVKEIKTDVKTLNGRAGKRWDSLVDKALAVLVGALVTYLITGGGL